MRSRIAAIATHLPSRVVSNLDLAAENPDWNMAAIAARAGVNLRHVAAEGETAFDLTKAACDKLRGHRLMDDVDAIIFCTQSPDHIMPPNAHLLHEYLDLPDEVMAFDINLACSGYIYGLAIAHSLIVSGMAGAVLLATADTYSKYIHKRDRSARVLFGDGAAVTLIEPSPSDSGFLSFELASHGKEYRKFYIPAGGQRLPTTKQTQEDVAIDAVNIRNQNCIQMDGLGVWSFINSAVPRQIRSYLTKVDLTLADIDLFFFHQASQLTLDSLVKTLGIESSRVVFDLSEVGNTVSASIPICMANAVRQGRLRPGQRILQSGFGVGLSYATTSFTYDEAIDVY